MFLKTLFLGDVLSSSFEEPQKNERVLPSLYGSTGKLHLRVLTRLTVLYEQFRVGHTALMVEGA